ncbi:MAG: type IV pilin protein [Spiribacter sp.]|jgi:type IV pilus assembly protein PilE|nr:type IV pilin protein [Spiribacter sp.]MDR9489054.1 type IV pilin protein [Spiribacter sp.]
MIKRRRNQLTGSNRDRVAGFSLLELLLVLSLIAIIATLALPSYRQPIERVERAQAATCLIQLGALIERQYDPKTGYAGIKLLASPLSCLLALEGRYAFAAGVPGLSQWSDETIDRQRWQLRAKRTASSHQSAEVCHGLVFQDTGARGVLDAHGVALFDAKRMRQCWH